MSHASGPPPEQAIRERDVSRIGHGGRVGPEGRDMTPATGRRGGPGSWKRAVAGARVALFKPGFEDARWSFLYKRDTVYAHDGAAADGQVVEAARRMRGGEEVPVEVQGPVINAPVWTWEVPLYFYLGGVATGSSMVAVACDASGDHAAAAVARKLAIGAIVPGLPLLILDLGRPLRFLNMLRIFKPRSAMNLGAWVLSAFSGVMSGAVAADVLGYPRVARVLGVKGALLGTYLGSYTGVLLASTAVPVWARSREFLPPIFICTAAATGAAANRLALAAIGVPAGHPTRRALATVETGAMTAELALSTLNERRLGRLGEALEHGRPGKLFTFAKWAVRGGLALRLGENRRPWIHNVASVAYLLAGLAFRFAWVGAGGASAADHEAVAEMARRKRRRVA